MNPNERVVLEDDHTENQSERTTADRMIADAIARHGSNLAGRLAELNQHIYQFRDPEKDRIRAVMEKEIEARATQENPHEQVDPVQLEERYQEYVRKGIGDAARVENFIRVTEQMIARGEELARLSQELNDDLNAARLDKAAVDLQIAQYETSGAHDPRAEKLSARLVKETLRLEAELERIKREQAGH